MTQFGHHLERHLAEIADQAPQSDSGWDQIRARIDKHIDEPEDEVIMLDVKNIPTDRRPGWTKLGLVGIAAGLFLAIVAVSQIRFDDDPPLTAGTEAEQVLALYIEAFNAGDVDGAISLFAADAVLTDGDPTFPRASGSPTVEQWESLLSFYAPQAAQISDAECTTITTAVDRAEVRCEWRLHDAVTRAINGAGDPVETEWMITEGKVVAFDRQIAWSALDHSAFMSWVARNHPEDHDALLRFPYELSSAEARQAGELTATYASEWGEQNP